MKSLRTLLSELSIATAFSLAVAGLVVPASVFGQPQVVASEGLPGQGHIQVEILELDDAGFPTSLTATSGDRKLRFELSEGAFYWSDDDDPRSFGSGTLPALDEVASWDVQLLEGRAFRAAIPAEHFVRWGPGEPAVPPIKELDGPGPETEEVETFGVFDPAAKGFELSAVLPGGQLVDMTVSLAALPPDARLGGAGTLGELSEKYWVFVAISIVLRILAIIFLTCAGLIAACGFVCSSTCPFGVISWNAQCGLNGGCNCNCDRPKPPICDGVVGQSDALKVTGPEPLVLPSSPFTLSRLEESDRVHHGQPVSFLMGEWALVSYGSGRESGRPQLEVLRASSPDYVASQLAGLEAAVALQAKELGPGRQTVLLVARPDHDDNSREIPLPRVRLSKGGLARGFGDGTVVVRADFSEDRELQGFEVLHETVGGLSAELEQELRRSLHLEYASERSHRAVVFAVLELAAGGIELVDDLAYLPKCCCGGQFCV